MYCLSLSFYATVNTAAGRGRFARRLCYAYQYLPKDYMACPTVGQAIGIDSTLGGISSGARTTFYVDSITTAIGPSFWDDRCGRDPEVEALESIILRLSRTKVDTWEEILNTEAAPRAGEGTLQALLKAGFKVSRQRP